MQNPYSLIFGKEPAQLIKRLQETDQILSSFYNDPPSQQIYMITGVRGSGKTVLMTEVSKKIAQHQDWICIELNPNRDLLQMLAAKLCSEHELSLLFQKANINLSLFGIGLEVSGVAPVADIETALSRMLQSLQSRGKKVLITIDEVTSTEQMRIFTSAFQIFLRQDLPVYLLMTGLYENISRLQDEKSLTFLYRAPKIQLSPLNIGTIAENYAKTFSLSYDTARHMAQLTFGYSFAFQVLGYFTWENDGDCENALPDVRQYLEDYVYQKIWSDLSKKEQQIVCAIASSSTGKTADIMNDLNITNSMFSPYRRRLIQKGLIDGSLHGHVRFTLPLFDRFALDHKDW